MGNEKERNSIYKMDTKRFCLVWKRCWDAEKSYDDFLGELQKEFDAEQEDESLFKEASVRVKIRDINKRLADDDKQMPYWKNTSTRVSKDELLDLFGESLEAADELASGRGSSYSGYR
jgi:hypothetical protein